MNIKFLTRSEIDDHKWNKCINESENGLIYAYSWYLDIVTENKWNALISGDYKFIMPLPWGKKYGLKYIYPPAFSQQGGIFSNKKIEKSTVFSFIENIPKEYKYVNIKFNSKNNFFSEPYMERPNYILPLNCKYEICYKGFSSNTKRNLKKTELSNLSIIKNLSVKDAIRSKSDNNINKLGAESLKKLELLLHIANEKKMLKIYAAQNEFGKIIGVSAFTFSHNRAYLALSASYKEGKNTSAMFLLINEFIMDHCNSDLMLDFEGSKIQGIARFFKSWGAVYVPYINYTQNNLPLPIKILFKKRFNGS